MLKASRRAEILIEPYKQLRFGLMFLVINLFFSALILSLFGFYMWDMYAALSEYFKLSAAESLMSMEKFGKPAALGVGLIVFFIATTLFASVRYTHQIYGPMVSIRRFLDEVLNGKKPSPIKLRASDQFQDLCELLNGVAEKFLHSSFEESQHVVSAFLDDLLAGKKPQDLELAKSDPFYAISLKLNKLNHN